MSKDTHVRVSANTKSLDTALAFGKYALAEAVLIAAMKEEKAEWEAWKAAAEALNAATKKLEAAEVVRKCAEEELWSLKDERSDQG